MNSFKVKLKKQIHGFTTDIIYDAESEFFYTQPKVKVHIPNTVFVVYVNWDDVIIQ